MTALDILDVSILRREGESTDAGARGPDEAIIAALNLIASSMSATAAKHEEGATRKTGRRCMQARRTRRTDGIVVRKYIVSRSTRRPGFYFR